MKYSLRFCRSYAVKIYFVLRFANIGKGGKLYKYPNFMSASSTRLFLDSINERIEDGQAAR